MARNTELQRFLDIGAGIFPPSVTASSAELNNLDGFNPLRVNAGVDVTVKTDSYTATLADANTCLNFGTVVAKSFSIPANTTVAFPVGTIFLIAKGTGALSLNVATDTLLGSVTLPASRGALIVKVAPTTWLAISS